MVPPKLVRLWLLYRVPVILGSASILFIIISLTILIKSVQTSTPISFSSGDASGSAHASTIVIDVSGAVVKPGVYALSPGSRVEDAIAAAGGLSGEADKERLAKVVNRAAKLSDGAKIYIPTLTGWNPANDDTTGFHPVSINAASQSELEVLTGVGPATAKKIIGGRPYTSLEELVQKKVMGKSLYDKLKSQLTL